MTSVKKVNWILFESGISQILIAQDTGILISVVNGFIKGEAVGVLSLKGRYLLDLNDYTIGVLNEK